MEFDIQQYIRGLLFVFSFKNRKGDRLFGYSTTKNASNTSIEGSNQEQELNLNPQGVLYVDLHLKGKKKKN